MAKANSNNQPTRRISAPVMLTRREVVLTIQHWDSHGIRDYLGGRLSLARHNAHIDSFLQEQGLSWPDYSRVCEQMVKEKEPRVCLVPTEQKYLEQEVPAL